MPSVCSDRRGGGAVILAGVLRKLGCHVENRDRANTWLLDILNHLTMFYLLGCEVLPLS